MRWYYYSATAASVNPVSQGK